MSRPVGENAQAISSAATPLASRAAIIATTTVNNVIHNIDFVPNSRFKAINVARQGT